MNEGKALGFMLIAILLIFSFEYAVDEVNSISNADPTNNGKAFMAFFTPWLWIILILSDLGVLINELFKDVK